MCSLAKQLEDCLTVNHTKTILEKTLQANAEYIYELIEQLPLEASHCELIFKKLSKSKAGDLLKLVEKLEQRIDFKFDKENYKKVLGYLDYGQTVDDIYNLLVKLKNIGVTLETNLVHDIVNKLKSKPNANDVYELLDSLQKIDIKLGENTAVCIVNELESGLTLDNVSTLLKKFRNIKVSLNSDMDGHVKDNVVDAIVKKLQSPQSAQNLLDLVKTLQELNIQPIANTCKRILNCLAPNQDAGNVANLLINLGNLVEFEKIQVNQSVYLPGIDDILKKIDGNQSAKDMLKLAKVLIAMGKSLQSYSKEFKDKIMCYSSNSELEELLKLKSSDTKYKEKQREFVKEFKQEIKPKKSEEKSNVGQITNSNSQDNGILNVDLNESEELLNLKSSDDKYKEKQSEFVKEFKQEIKPKKSEKESNVEQIANSNSKDNAILNVDLKKNVNLGNIEKKPTSEADNKKAVLKILGGIFAILGILCIISSLTIAESVLLGLLIPGCGLLTAGIIFILVGLFLNNKNDKPPINLPSGNRQHDFISDPGDNIDQSLNLEARENMNRN